MSKGTPIGRVDRLTITTIMDNYVDVFLPSTEMTKRWGPPDMVPCKSASHGKPAPLWAEHGLSLLIEAEHEGLVHRILFDTGFTDDGVPHNLNRLGIDTKGIDFIVVSHGHPDHTAAVPGVLRSAGKKIPVITHPDAFLKRYLVFPNGDRVLSNTFDKTIITSSGGEAVLTSKDTELAPGVIATGEINMINDFEQHFPLAYYEKEGELTKDLFHDEKSLVIHLKNAGIVVLSGCSHRGIINTVNYAKKLTGIDEVYAVIGGFHLTGTTSMERVTRTVAEMKKIRPRFVIPTHCTGWRAINLFAEEMKDSFLLNAVGTKYFFE